MENNLPGRLVKIDLPVFILNPDFYFLMGLSKLSNRFLKNFKSSLVVKDNKWGFI